MSAQDLAKKHAFPVELVKQASSTGFNNDKQPQILSGYRRRFRLQYHTGNK
jgi:hypothetical protein